MGTAKRKDSETYSLVVSENALTDIETITWYIAKIKQQPLNAIRVGEKILQTIDRIEKNPLAFRECEEIPTKTKMYRKAVCMSWNIIYRIKSNKVLILGIIHGSRRPSKTKNLRKIKK